MYKSIIEQRGSAAFPEFTGERIYMHSFTQADGLPDHLARWQTTVDQMLEGVNAPGPIYLMVDQAKVAPGHTHRRPGVHIDGYWHPALEAHGFFGGGHGYTAPSHSYTPPSHAPVPIADLGRPRKIPVKRKKPVAEEVIPPLPPLNIPHPRRKRRLAGWGDATFDAPEAIILASNLAGAEGYTGDYSGAIGDGGDCARIDLSGLQRLPMGASRVYAGNVSALHQSLPLPLGGERTLVRLNVPGWTPGLQ